MPKANDYLFLLIRDTHTGRTGRIIDAKDPPPRSKGVGIDIRVRWHDGTPDSWHDANEVTYELEE